MKPKSAEGQIAYRYGVGDFNACETRVEERQVQGLHEDVSHLGTHQNH